MLGALVVAAGVVVIYAVWHFALREESIDAVPVVFGEAVAAETDGPTIIGYDCARCGAPLHFGQGETVTKCEYCGRQMRRRL